MLSHKWSLCLLLGGAIAAQKRLSAKLKGLSYMVRQPLLSREGGV